MARRILALLVLAGLTHVVLANAVIKSVRDLKRVLLEPAPGAEGCVRLLHRAGSIGCFTPQDLPVTAPMFELADAHLTGHEAHPANSIALVPARLVPSFFALLAATPSWGSSLAACLIASTVPPPPSARFSPAPAAPLAEYVPRGLQLHQWNPRGTGQILQALPFPVFVLDPSTSSAVGLQLKSGDSAAFPRREARLDCAMASARESNATECIDKETCLPVGGHSIWAVLGARPSSTPPPDDSVILLCSAFGARTLAPGAARGADAALSGSVAALLAAKLLGRASTTLAQPPLKQVAVALWAGQEWGHLGVRRLLWDLHRTSDFAEARRQGAPAPPFRPSALHAVLAMGSVGRAVRSGNATGEPARLFVHRHATDLQREDLSQALMRAGGATRGRAHVARPATFAAHPPPSAADPFVGRRGALQAAVLSQDDAELAGADLDSWTDALDGVSPAAVARAAEVAARAGWEMATGGAALPGSLLDPEALEAEAAALMQCLATAWPGLDCPLGRRLSSRTRVAVAHGYLGALRSAAAPGEEKGAAPRSDFERFAHAYLALAAGGVDPETLDEEEEEGRCRVGAKGKKSPCQRGEVCVAERNYPGLKGKGWCLSVQAGFVEAYSTALEYNASAPDHRWTVSAAAQAWEAEAGWPVDALWVESYWPQGVPSASFFTAEAAGLQSKVLWSGFVAVAAFMLAAVALEKAHGARRRGADV